MAGSNKKTIPDVEEDNLRSTTPLLEEKNKEGGEVEVNIDDGGPPVYWVIIAFVCANAYSSYNICIKKGSASINPIMGGVILQFVAAAFGSVVLGVMVLINGTSSLKYDNAGLLWSCAAGIAVGIAEILSFFVSGLGVNATQSIPIIVGGSVLFGAFLGLIMLGESMMWPGWVGVALVTTGIGFVATSSEQASIRDPDDWEQLGEAIGLMSYLWGTSALKHTTVSILEGIEDQ
eukprot:scaffold37547_cov75-Cyclotella_meneghiniana.AAC.3